MQLFGQLIYALLFTDIVIELADEIVADSLLEGGLSGGVFQGIAVELLILLDGYDSLPNQSVPVDVLAQALI